MEVNEPMVKQFKLLAVVIFLCTSAMQAQSGDIHNFMKIEPLVATKADVERIFGSPTSYKGPYVSLYETEEATMRFTYSKGGCNVDRNGWDMAADTVIRTDITLRKSIRPDELGIEMRTFKKYPVKDVANAFSIESDTEGIYISLAPNGFVEGVERQPGLRFDSKACSRTL